MKSAKGFGVLTLTIWLMVTPTAAANLWSYVDDYAPILQFNNLIVDVHPTGFEGDYSGYCTYVNVKTESSGYLFQYWFYYRYDIRVSREIDALLDLVADGVSSLGILKDKAEEAFHDHDWELVEVRVSSLGGMPSWITYYAHGDHYGLSPTGWPWAAPMQGKHPVVKIVTDMHGSYPAGVWTPALGAWSSFGANAEFSIAYTWEVLAGYRPELGRSPSYKIIDFTRKCRPFTESMMSVHNLHNYPHPMPWDKGFRYSN